MSDDSRLLASYGPWALITGASSGIGLALAQNLAVSGMNLVLVARRLDVLNSIARELNRTHGVQCLPVGLDLGQASSAAELDLATAKLDIGLLVAAAGFGTSGNFLHTDESAEMEMVAVNCVSALALCKRFAPRFAARGTGGIVLLSSIVAFQGVPGAANYAATKAYIQALAEGLRFDLAGSGVSVLAAAPGPVASAFAARAGMQMGQTSSPQEVAKGVLAALGRRSFVRPGWLSKTLGWSLASAPRWARTRIMAGIMRGMIRPPAWVPPS